MTTKRNIEEPQQKYGLGTVSNILLVGGRAGLQLVFHWIQTLPLSFCTGLKHLVRIKVFQPINIGNKQITDKAYDDMIFPTSARQTQCIVTPGDPLGVKQHH